MCDTSPITGTRYSKAGANYDLCSSCYAKLDEEKERAKFTRFTVAQPLPGRGCSCCGCFKRLLQQFLALLAILLLINAKYEFISVTDLLWQALYRAKGMLPQWPGGAGEAAPSPSTASLAIDPLFGTQVCPPPPPGPHINITAWVFWMSGCADVELRATQICYPGIGCPQEQLP